MYFVNDQIESNPSAIIPSPRTPRYLKGVSNPDAIIRLFNQRFTIMVYYERTPRTGTLTTDETSAKR